ncbi:MAG: autotransporter outer membrane beta-barrel domain-containing protein [Verrucomicrobiales bacterium]|nr:autotransporter outer membrane beta-barrel domain-containing protein [Verrucomicrobiales bacterium]
MHINRIINRAALLLTVGGMATAPLTVAAQNLVVTSDTTVSGTHYENNGTGYAALTNTGAWTFTGSAVTLTGTAASGNGQHGARFDGGGTLNLFSSTVSANAYGIYVGNTSAARVDHLTVIATGSGARGIYVNRQSAVTVTDLTITTQGNNSNGITVSNTGALIASDGKIVIVGDNAIGTVVNNASTAWLSDFTVETDGYYALGLSVTAGGTDAASASTGTFNRVQVLTRGDESYGVRVGAGGTDTGYNYAELADSTVTTAGRNATGINIYGVSGHTSYQRLILDHVTVTAVQSYALSIGDDSERIRDFGTDPKDFTRTDGTFELIIRNGTELNPAAGKHAIFMDTKISGTNTGNPTILSGTQGRMVLTAQVADSAINGSISIQTSATATLDLTNSTLSGDALADGVSSLTLSGSDSAITGDVTASGSAVINVTVSGSNSTLLGDIAQHDNTAAVTVILNDSATGQGGYNGGNLITGSDSVWIFNKDSHGNYGENDGVWNLGDYEVIFDNMTHTGTLNLSVNSDTGEGGSITVTDTADGEGRVHIDTTGNGQADPNKVLPGKVTGNGTEHWQWDPIDWGIDTIIKDGNHFIKSGVNPAGAVLNSSVATQQAMWFAQQNSLLKRMGDLRYGARVSRPLAGETPAFHNLIENIWLRSYGQQLNVGSKVSGKAYEQLIYGVDLGTDHKFTISADSDLYLGVYAGYGRSDIDYRTPGADGELNSYCGGLYATWLHASGFYIDATFKAASVDNDLKAPYGNTQLTASYSDVNIGGSLEIGHKFTFTDDWFIEPQFQVNYLHILAEDYQAGPMSISAQDLDALQLRIGSLFGRTIKLTNSGALQPYVKISGVETISSGGALRNGYQSTRANTDGARAELGAGLIWQLDADNQLHLDYEASFGDKYDKPWGLTAGYRHQF